MIHDPSTYWLTQQIQHHSTEKSLWFCDENMLKQLPLASSWQEKPVFITNRWDLAKHAEQLGFSTEFSDFDLTGIAANSIDHIFYRISKEKAIVHHLINESQRILKDGGVLWISGQKNEGIKTYIEKASILFGCGKNIRKDGVSYSSELTKGSFCGDLLDDENYHQLRLCLTVGNSPTLSKPGQFGWNKIDQGSEFLITELRRLINFSSTTIEHYLDLGCGYGYLTIASQDLNAKHRTLTDNNAAALMSAKENCAQLNIKAEIIATDAGKQLQQKFDLILCNPPFHQGFDVDDDLTEKFLRNASNLLTPKGTAYFVVNQFIALEKKALTFFKHVKLIAKNKSFCAFELRKN